MDIDQHDPPRKRVSFDPTINLGHVLTFLGALAVGVGGYTNLNTRLTVQEQLTAQQQVQRLERDQAFKETMNEVKGDVKEMRRSIDDLTKSLGSKR